MKKKILNKKTKKNKKKIKKGGFEEKIDIVIAYHPKDKKVLPYSVEGTKNIKNRNNVYIISSEDPKIEGTIFIDENTFPFKKDNIKEYFGEKDSSRAGWYFKQLMNLYAHRVITNITDKFLLLDCDTLFINEVSMIDEEGKSLYSTGSENHRPYFEHMKKLIPGLDRQIPEKSGIVHHLMVEKKYLDEIIQKVEEIHKKDFWKVMMELIDKNEIHGSGFAEYEIYFNYMLKYHPGKIKLRDLRWGNYNELPDNKNVNTIKDLIIKYKDKYDAISLHSYLINENTFKNNSKQSGGDKKKVIHKIVTKKTNGINPAGFGDFIKGTITLYLLSKELNYDLLIDFNDHAIKKFIINTYSDNVSDIKGYPNTTTSYDKLKNSIKNNLEHTDKLHLITNVFNDFKLDDNDRFNLQNMFKPTKELENYINKIKEDIQLNNDYIVLHIRSGDYEITKNKSNNYNINTKSSPRIDSILIKEVEDNILSFNIEDKEILCISDSKTIIDYFKNKYKYKTTGSTPIHFASLHNNNTKIDLPLLSTMADFFIMKDAKKIYSISVNEWNSGFSSMAATLFNIAIEKKNL